VYTAVHRVSVELLRPAFTILPFLRILSRSRSDRFQRARNASPIRIVVGYCVETLLHHITGRRQDPVEEVVKCIFPLRRRRGQERRRRPTGRFLVGLRRRRRRSMSLWVAIAFLRCRINSAFVRRCFFSAFARRRGRSSNNGRGLCLGLLLKLRFLFHCRST